MSGIILYKSKYGSTKKYAEWLAEETGFEMVETDKARIEDVCRYDEVILGGGVYASGIAGFSFLKKNWGKLKGKKVIVFMCGASPYDEDAFGTVVEFNMKGELSQVPCFYARGAFDMPAMTFKDRALCKLLRKAVAKKKPEDCEVWERALMEAPEDQGCDWTDRSYILPILDCLARG